MLFLLSSSSIDNDLTFSSWTFTWEPDDNMDFSFNRAELSFLGVKSLGLDTDLLNNKSFWIIINSHKTVLFLPNWTIT